VASTPSAGGPPDISLEESILSLQVITDMASTGIKPNKDVNGDNKIGLAEVIYGLTNGTTGNQ
jgi:hypothetical protein